MDEKNWKENIVKVGEYGKEYDLAFYGQLLGHSQSDRLDRSLRLYEVQNYSVYLLVGQSQYDTLVCWIDCEKLFRMFPDLARLAKINMRITLDNAINDFGFDV